MKFRQTDEGFDWVLKGESVDDQHLVPYYRGFKGNWNKLFCLYRCSKCGVRYSNKLC